MFRGKVAVITGASSGIGEAVALAFAAEGANLAITGRNNERLKIVSQKCKKLGAGGLLEVIADLTVVEDIQKLADEAIGRYHRIDILVNNAGSTAVCSFLQTSLKDLERIFNTNVRAPFLLSQLLLPMLVESKGCIVNISSITATTIYPNGLAYGMSKASLDHFTQALAFECAKSGVRVNGVSPGCVKTRQMADDSKLTSKQIDDILTFMSTTQPLGTMGGLIKAEDVAKSVIFLASPEASCITGHTIKIEAGYNAFHAMPIQADTISD